jgi:hypothetical protein
MKYMGYTIERAKERLGFSVPIRVSPNGIVQFRTVLHPLRITRIGSDDVVRWVGTYKYAKFWICCDIMGRPR